MVWVHAYSPEGICIAQSFVKLHTQIGFYSLLTCTYFLALTYSMSVTLKVTNWPVQAQKVKALQTSRFGDMLDAFDLPLQPIVKRGVSSA